MKKYILICTFIASSLLTFAQKKAHFITITFKEGNFKGTHTFYPEKGNYASQINLEFFNGSSNLNASKIVAKNGLQIHYINRHFLGEATVGSHKAKKHTSGCGSLNFIDLKNIKPYKRINGDFSGCTNTKITKVGAWKKGVVKRRRTVSGSFSDMVTFEYRMDDGTKKIIKTKVEVNFNVRESRRK